MQIRFDLDIDKDKEERVIASLSCKPAELSKALSVYSKAALLEYVEMFCDASAFRTIADAREQRLLQIILAAFDGGLPDEAVVAHLFHLTRVQARSLLRSVLEKRDFELREQLRKACVVVLQTIDRAATPLHVKIKNPRVYEALDRILTDYGEVPILELVGPSKYKLDKKSLDVLRAHFNLTDG